MQIGHQPDPKASSLLSLETMFSRTAPIKHADLLTKPSHPHALQCV